MIDGFRRVERPSKRGKIVVVVRVMGSTAVVFDLGRILRKNENEKSVGLLVGVVPSVDLTGFSCFDDPSSFVCFESREELCHEFDTDGSAHQQTRCIFPVAKATNSGSLTFTLFIIVKIVAL